MQIKIVFHEIVGLNRQTPFRRLNKPSHQDILRSGSTFIVLKYVYIIKKNRIYLAPKSLSPVFFFYFYFYFYFILLLKKGMFNIVALLCQ